MLVEVFLGIIFGILEFIEIEIESFKFEEKFGSRRIMGWFS